jgi:hypothetical protein
MTEVKCATCGLFFIATRKDREYCTARCAERAGKIRRRYGISARDVYSMYKKQDGKCAVCGEEGDIHEMGFTHKPTLNIDHCHETTHVRGLLCQGCNLGIGHLKDDVEILKQAIKYLNKARRVYQKEKVTKSKRLSKQTATRSSNSKRKRS